MAGASHLIALLLVVVGVGIFGAYKIVSSHADSIRVDCSDSGTKYASSDGHSYEKYNCKFYTTAKVVNSSQIQVGSIPAGTNWILCQEQGATYHNGSYYDNWWAWTKANNGVWGWVNGVYGNGGANNSTMGSTNGAFGYGIPQCHNLTLTTPGGVPGGGSSATYKLSCSATYGPGVAGSPISVTVSSKNMGSASSPSTLTANIGMTNAFIVGSNTGGAGALAKIYLPSIPAGGTYSKSVSVGPYARGSYFTLVAGISNGTGCSGSKSYTL